MKYSGMPFGMRILFEKSFRDNLAIMLGLEKLESKTVMKKAKTKYKEMIVKLPELEKWQ